MLKKIKNYLKELKNVNRKFNLVLSLIISFCEAFAYIYSGMYGSLDNLGTGNAIIILLQLVFAGVVVIMLDEMLQVIKNVNIEGWLRNGIRYITFYCYKCV